MAKEVKAEARPAEAPPADEAFDPRDAKIIALEEQLARIERMIGAGAVNAVEAQQEAKSRKEQEAIRKEIDKGNTLRTQEHADKLFPTGRQRFACVLEDGNRHPKLEISADNEVDARGRYAAACGINSYEKPITVTPAG